MRFGMPSTPDGAAARPAGSPAAMLQLRQRPLRRIIFDRDRSFDPHGSIEKRKSPTRFRAGRIIRYEPALCQSNYGHDETPCSLQARQPGQQRWLVMITLAVTFYPAGEHYRRTGRTSRSFA